jgi:hypothetical protein
LSLGIVDTAQQHEPSILAGYVTESLPFLTSSPEDRDLPALVIADLNACRGYLRSTLRASQDLRMGRMSRGAPRAQDVPVS